MNQQMKLLHQSLGICNLGRNSQNVSASFIVRFVWLSLDKDLRLAKIIARLFSS
jgi:hypothetical protein